MIYKGFSVFERECFLGEKLSFSGFRAVSNCLRSRKIVVVRLLPLHNTEHDLRIVQALIWENEYPNITAVISNISAIQESVPVEGIIGYQILSPQRSILDFKNNQLILEKAQKD